VTALTLTLGGNTNSIRIQTVIVAGWTGRHQRALEQHLAELEEMGVARPSRAPIFYRVSASRLTTASEIESTTASSGEVEAILLRHEGKLWVGAGSDHTDRDLESYSVAASKQLCDKPMASELWPFDEVLPHWDRLILRSWISESGTEAVYQEGHLEELLGAEKLVGLADPPLTQGTLMFCGTVPARGGIRPSPEFRYELEDPVRGRAIQGRYAVRTLPLVA
jgi:hypothetical protein